MYYRSKRTTLLILFVTAALCARAMFLFFRDPEGSNLLIVAVATGIVYACSLMVYVSKAAGDNVAHRPSPTSLPGLGRLLLALSVQVLLVSFFALILR